MLEPQGARRRFELKRLLGTGSFGEVYLAEQVSAGDFRKRVALKVLNNSAAQIKDAARRMRDEARILGRLQHRNIVEVLDLVQLGDRWAVVMAYVPGADLEQLLEHGLANGTHIPLRAVWQAVAAVARALDAAWKAEGDDGQPLRVVHRDIKPGNLRLTAEGDVKVLDFGVARVDFDAREAKTRRPGLIGTERYMAPERLTLEGDGPPGDIYALGVTAFELLTNAEAIRAPVRPDAHEAAVDAMVLACREARDSEAMADSLALLREMLAWAPEERPVAELVAARAERLAARCDDADLPAFASYAVPPLERAGSAGQLPVSTLYEGSTPLAGGTEPLPDVRPVWPWVAIGGVAIVGLLSAILAFSLGGSAPDGSGASPRSVPAAPSGGVTAAQLAEGAPADERVAAPSAPPTAPAAGPASTLAPPTLARELPASAAVAPAPAVGKSGAMNNAPATQAPPKAIADASAAPQAARVAPAAEAPRVSRAQVTVTDVSGFEVDCGGRKFSGTASVRVVDVPAGACTVRAERSGQWYTGRVSLTAPTEIRCVVQGERLQCQ